MAASGGKVLSYVQWPNGSRLGLEAGQERRPAAIGLPLVLYDVPLAVRASGGAADRWLRRWVSG